MKLTDEEIIRRYIDGSLFKVADNTIVYDGENNFYAENHPEEVQNIIDAYLDSKGIKKVVHRQRQRIKKAYRIYEDEKIILQNIFKKPHEYSHIK